MTVIRTQADVSRGVRALKRKCATMRRLHAIAGDPPVRHVGHGFEGLARIVVGQQLSVASASAIWRRTRELMEPFDAAQLLAKSDDTLRGAGLSAGKVRTLRALAEACLEDGLDVDGLEGLDDDAIRDRLTAVVGIGPWTSDIYIMFCLGRGDAWASGDLALQEAAKMALGLGARPRAVELEALSQRWRPWRGVAARLLWAYYAVARRRDGGDPM